MPRLADFESFQQHALQLCSASPITTRLVLKHRPCDSSCSATVSDDKQVRHLSLLWQSAAPNALNCRHLPTKQQAVTCQNCWPFRQRSASVSRHLVRKVRCKRCMRLRSGLPISACTVPQSKDSSNTSSGPSSGAARRKARRAAGKIADAGKVRRALKRSLQADARAASKAASAAAAAGGSSAQGAHKRRAMASAE